MTRIYNPAAMKEKIKEIRYIIAIVLGIIFSIILTFYILVEIFKEIKNVNGNSAEMLQYASLMEKILNITQS